MKVIGLDLSLTATGVAIYTHGAVTTQVIPTFPTVRADLSDEYMEATRLRIRGVRGEVLDLCTGADLVVVEGPALGVQGAGRHNLDGLWWLVYDGLKQRDLRVGIVPPNSLKLFATGKGNASKDTVLISTVRRFPDVEVTDNNSADALWLCAMGARALGMPFEDVPQNQRVALGKIKWPTMGPLAA
jgi:crossover junction endodeoxyribonuclease RuvC